MLSAETQQVARYVSQVVADIDHLPAGFFVRRSPHWFGRFVHPAFRSFVRYFVRQQLGPNLKAAENAARLHDLADGRTSAEASELAAIGAALGQSRSRVVVASLLLAIVAMAVTFLAAVIPSLRDDAELLGSLPTLISLNADRVVDAATAFDDDTSTFTFTDAAGVSGGIALALAVLWLLLSLVSSSYHVANAILSTRRPYHREQPLSVAQRRPPVRVQQALLGRYIERIHVPVGVDIIRNAVGVLALVLIVIGPLVALLEPRDEAMGLFGLEAVPSSQVLMTLLQLAPFLGIAGAVLLRRHLRRRRGQPPSSIRWPRTALALLFAGLLGVGCAGLVAGAGNIRVTSGPDYEVWPQEQGEPLSAEVLDAVEQEPGLRELVIQRFWAVPATVAVDGGPDVPGHVVLTELRANPLSYVGLDRAVVEQMLSRQAQDSTRPVVALIASPDEQRPLPVDATVDVEGTTFDVVASHTLRGSTTFLLIGDVEPWRDVVDLDGRLWFGTVRAPEGRLENLISVEQLEDVLTADEGTKLHDRRRSPDGMSNEPGVAATFIALFAFLCYLAAFGWPRWLPRPSWLRRPSWLGWTRWRRSGRLSL